MRQLWCLHFMSSHAFHQEEDGGLRSSRSKQANLVTNFTLLLTKNTTCLMSTQMSRLLIRPALFRVQPASLVAPRVESQRLFSCTSRRWTEEKPEATEEPALEEEQQTEEPEPVKLSRRRRRFHDWVREDGARFARPSQGTTNYLGSTVR